MSERASGYEKVGPPPRPTPASMTSTWYYCRYHGRRERTDNKDSCRTAEEVWAEYYKPPKKDDPPCLWARILMFLGVDVKP